MKRNLNNFVYPKIKAGNLDTFWIRKSIFDALEKNLPKFKGRLLDVGCGEMPYRDFIEKQSEISEYVGLDIDTALPYHSDVKPDARWDGDAMPFDDNSFETAIGTELLEHCPDPGCTLREIRRVLKPGGIFFFTVPFLWPLHESPNDQYRYTPFALEKLMQNAGFKKIEISAGGGWHASLAQMLGLFHSFIHPVNVVLIDQKSRFPVDHDIQNSGMAR